MNQQMNYAQTMYANPPIRNVNSSAVAATSVPSYDIKKEDAGRVGAAISNVKGAVTQLDPSQLLNKDFMLEMAEGGLPLMGPFGNVAGAAIGFLVADRRAQKQTQAIIDQYRDEIAQQLNISEESVDARALLMAAQHHKGLRQAINMIQDERGAHPFVNIAGLLGMAAGVGLVIPMLFAGPPGWIAGMIAGGAGYMAGNFIGEKLLSPDEKQNPLTVMDEIRAKVEGSEQALAEDVFKLRVTQNSGINERIINQYGEPFYKLGKQDQQYAMSTVRGAKQLCERDAQLINEGGNLDMLMFGPMPEPVAQMQPAQTQPEGRWAARVGSKVSIQGNFADRIRQTQMAPTPANER